MGKVFYEAAVKAILEDRDLQRVGPQDEEIRNLLGQTQWGNSAFSGTCGFLKTYGGHFFKK